MTTNDQARQNNLNSNRTPIFFREEYAGFIVKGNFMTLAAKPVLVEEGEWLAHQSKWRDLVFLRLLTTLKPSNRTAC